MLIAVAPDNVVTPFSAYISTNMCNNTIVNLDSKSRQSQIGPIWSYSCGVDKSQPQI